MRAASLRRLSYVGGLRYTQGGRWSRGGDGESDIHSLYIVRGVRE